MVQSLQNAGLSPRLPEIRGELQLMPASPEPDGAPAWIIYDPVRDRYFRLLDRAAALLACWRGQARDVFIGDVEREKGLLTDAEETEAIQKFLLSNELTVAPMPDTSKSRLGRRSILSAVVEKAQAYGFLRLRLCSPAKFLAAALPFARPLLSRTAAKIIAVIGLVGLYLVSRQWDAFLSEISGFMSFAGLMASLVSLALAKLVHEFAHALVATKYGVRVNSAGVSFYFGFPLLFTDVSGAWKLQSRRERMLIDAAGVIGELYLAACATLLWVFLSEGPLRSAVFTIAAVTWITSLAINLNPLARFDGYYILCDLFRFPNLATRAAAFGQWFSRETLFGLGKPEPEHVSSGTRLGLITYAYASWAYRMTVIFGLSYFFYAIAFKLLAVVLIPIQIVVFVFLPIWKEMQEWWKMRDEILSSPRSTVMAAVILACFLLLFIPLPKNIRVPAVFQNAHISNVHFKQEGRVAEIAVREGQLVEAGQLLVRLEDPKLKSELEKANYKITLLDARLARMAGADRELNDRLVLMQQRAAEKARKVALEKALRELSVVAPTRGILREFDRDMQVGGWVSKTQKVATVVAKTGAQVEGYISETDRLGLQPGWSGRFVADNPMAGSFPVRLERISATGLNSIEHKELSTEYGGSVVSQLDSEKELKPVDAQYRVSFRADLPSPQNTVRGVVRISGPYESFAATIWRAVSKVVVRESGF